MAEEAAVPTEVTDEPQPTPDASEGAQVGSRSSDELIDLAERAGDEEDERGVRTAAESASAIGQGRQISDPEADRALAWFLSDEPVAPQTEDLELDFGTEDAPQIVPWTIQAVTMDVMRQIRKEAAETKTARKSGQVDESRVNLAVVVAGTVSPDIKQAAIELFQAGRGSGDPIQTLKERFEVKPGFIAQLAGRIMSLSGFDDEDVREVEAAKNS